MLDDAKVTLSLDDFDELRANAERYIAFRKQFGELLETKDEKYQETGDSKDLIVNVDLEEVEKFIRQYGLWGKDEFEFVDTYEMSIEFKNK